MRGLWRKLGAAYRKVRSVEPARVRAFYTALVATLAANGIAVSADVDKRVQLALSLLTVVAPFVQGETTRAKVTPTSKLGGDA